MRRRHGSVMTELLFFFSSRRRHTRLQGDWSSDVCSSDLFAYTDDKNVRRGFDVDLCRALAAAVLGDADKVQLSPLGLRDGFATLTTGGVDVLTHRLTWTYNRDNGGGLDFLMVVYYDGQGFMVPKAMGVKSVNDLKGASICVAQGSTTELNIADYFRARKMDYRIVTFQDLDEARNAYDQGRCDAWTNDQIGRAHV